VVVGMVGLVACVLFIDTAVQLRNAGTYPPSELGGLNSYFELFGVVGVIFGVIVVLGMMWNRK
jgi:hypothetical protein